MLYFIQMSQEIWRFGSKFIYTLTQIFILTDPISTKLALFRLRFVKQISTEFLQLFDCW
jgi:hypothetical protein